jgi:hypothetical protein
MAFLSANSYMGLVVEATRGTLPTGGTPVYIPVTTPQVTPMQTFLRDEAFRSSPVMVYDQVQGVRHDEYDAKFYLFADTFGNFVKAVLGGTDTVTPGTPGVSNTHVIKLLNSASTGSQPPSYSILDFDGANYFTITGAQADSINLTFGAEAAADATVKFFGNPYTSYTSAPAPFTTSSFSTEHMIPAWDTSISVGGTTFNYIQTGELKLERKTAPIFTMGSQAPLTNFAGPIEVTGKFTAIVNSNNDVWSTGTNAEALTRSPQAVVITLTDPNDSTSSVQHSVSFTMTAAQFYNVKRVRSKEYTEIEVEFTANANSTDASGTGYSPISATIVNAQSTAY